MTDITASIRARLLAWAQKRNIPFQYASMLYMQEGIVSRLAASPFADRLILKGGFLLFVYSESSGRMTKDIDFLGQGISNDEQALAGAISQILDNRQDDGLVFNTQSLLTERITEGAEYHGVRISFGCTLGSLRNRLHIDIGFGDALSPGPVRISMTGMLGRHAIEVTAYPLSAVIAEKFETMIALGSISSRMKDYYDIAYIFDHYDIPERELKEAIFATFSRRNTELPEHPELFSPSFIDSEKIRALWSGFLKRTQLHEVVFSSVVTTLRERLEPYYQEFRISRGIRYPTSISLNRGNSTSRC